MRLPPKNGSGSSTTRNKHPNVSTNTGTSTNTSLQELVAASFDTLEDNLNDIIAFEEVANKKNDDFDRARKMLATPSERYVMPSPRVPSKTVMPSQSPVQEAKKRLSLSSDYSSPSRKPSTAPKKKRTSFTSDSSWMKSSKDTNDGEIIKPSSIRRASATSVQSATNSHSSSKEQSSNGEKKQVPSKKLFRKPSERALRELKELSSKFDSDMEITELRQELQRASINYEVLGNQPPFGIGNSERSDNAGQNVNRRRMTTRTTSKRISFQKGLPETLNDNDVHGAVKERLAFFRTSLQQYTEQQQEQQQSQEVSESETDDTSKDQHLSREINTKRPSGASLASIHAERRLSDVTLDTAIGNLEKQQGKRLSHVTVEDADDDDHDDKLNVAKEMVYGDGGKSMQTTPQTTPTASGSSGNSKRSKEEEEKKRKFGESLSRFFSALKAWFQRRIEAFVASFTPKEQMIVKQMG